MRLTEALEETATAALRRMASAHGLPLHDGVTRAELIERLAERLTDPNFLRSEIAALGDAERGVLGLARANESGEVRGLIADRDFPGAADVLAEHGLLFRVFAAAGPLRGEVFAAPAEVLELLPQPAADTGPPLDASPPPGAERRASDPAFSLFCIASALGRRGNALEADVRAWSEEPGGWPWDARWRFLQRLGEAAGLLVHRADGNLVAGPSFVRLLDDPVALFGRLWRAFRRDRGLVELAQIGLADGPELAGIVTLRGALLDSLKGLPHERWVAVDALSDWLRRVRPNVVREQLSPRGLVVAEGLDWSELEGRLVRYLVLGPLYWLGVVGASTDGARVVRRRPAEARPVEPCAWEGEADLVAPTRAALGTLLDAERYLVLRQRGRPSRYHLVQSHVAAALGSGGSVAECRRLLVRLTQNALPAAVDERLTTWEQSFGALSVRPAVLLESRSAGELDAALDDERVQPFVRARLSPTVAEVAAADALELAAALRDGDHLPRVDAALRLSSDTRQAYAGLVDEQVLEFLLVSLLAFSSVRAEVLTSLEGSAALLERLERQFPPQRLRELRAAAAALAGQLGPPTAAVAQRKRPRRRSRSARRGPA